MSISTGGSREEQEKATDREAAGEGARTAPRDGLKGGALPRGTGAAAARANAAARSSGARKAAPGAPARGGAAGSAGRGGAAGSAGRGGAAAGSAGRGGAAAGKAAPARGGAAPAARGTTPARGGTTPAQAKSPTPKVAPEPVEVEPELIDLDEDVTETDDILESPADPPIPPARISSARTAPTRPTSTPTRTTSTPERTTTRTGAPAGTGSPARPTVTGRTAAGRPTANRSAPRKTTGPAPRGGGKGRRPPVKINAGRNWGPIAMFGTVGLVVVAIIVVGVVALAKKPDPSKWHDRADAIPGLVDYVAQGATWLTANHKSGVLTYQTNPPVGGDHNPVWQDCMGNVYPSEIPKEQATHSLEHGAVWVTYRPDLPQDQVDVLSSKVTGTPYMLMSPYPSLDRPISLQAWGYQLKVDDASDPRIDEFIQDLRLNAAVEPGAACSGGLETLGSTPEDSGAAPMGAAQ